MREGTYVYLCLIHVGVWQKPTQYCKAVVLQLKTKRDLNPWNKQVLGLLGGYFMVYEIGFL